MPDLPTLASLNWLKKAPGSRYSEYVLGRTANQLAFAIGKPFTVSVYKGSRNRLFYTDPVRAENEPGPGVLYRIRVTPKRKLKCSES